MSAPRVLLVGFDSHTVPGVDAQLVEMAIAIGEEQLQAAGYDTTYCLFAADDPADAGRVVDALSTEAWDCVVVGGGIRKAEEQLAMFERIVNLTRVLAPQAAIAFNSTGADSVDAVRRWLDDPNPSLPE
jgi:hypothetical protein